MTCYRLISILIFVWQILSFLADGAKQCSLQDIFGCQEGETCQQKIITNETVGNCVCRANFTRTSPSGACVPVQNKPHDSTHDFSTGVSASAIAVGLLVPIFSLLIIGGLVLAARRYRWIHRFREQTHQLSVASYDTVLVDQAG